MAPRKTAFIIAAVALGLVGTGCTEDQTSSATHPSHHVARRQVTGSNVPQAPAYGDGVSDADTRSNLGEMEQASSTHMGGGMSGGGGGR